MATVKPSDMAGEILAIHSWSALAGSCVSIATILALGWGAHHFGTRLIRAFRIRLSARMHNPEQVRRAETLGRALRYLLSVIVVLTAGMLTLAQLGVSIAPILGAAGVAGLAIGFGAQSLVKDYFSGFFLLLENQLAKGDVVQVADKAGLVEDVTLRYVQLRDYDGNVHFVPNGLISTVTNMSRDFAYAVIDVSVAYQEDLDEVYAAITATAEQLRADAAFGPRILGGLEIAGVERWADSAVIVRCRFKVQSLQQWSVRREYLRRLKCDFDARGIEIPFPHLTLYAGSPKRGVAPAFNVQNTGSST
jgi:moderate conductance mechanosensitive channel